MEGINDKLYIQEQEVIINLQKKRNEALQELIMKAETDLKQKNETLTAIERKCTLCQKAIKVTKTPVAECELQERKVSINVQFWKELMTNYISKSISHVNYSSLYIMQYTTFNVLFVVFPSA